jgi:hypothetical protein
MTHYLLAGLVGVGACAPGSPLKDQNLTNQSSASSVHEEVRQCLKMADISVGEALREEHTP